MRGGSSALLKRHESDHSIAKGVQFMHENNVAHRSVHCLSPLFVFHSTNLTYTRDCAYANIMLDPSNMYPESFHPARMSRSRDFYHKAKAYTRTRRPSRYLLIDFGLSRYYDPTNGPPLDKPLRGGDRSAPEHQDGKTLCDPFPTDVYYLGNLVREYFMQVRVCIHN
jgi:serine/threonine protein kinase